MSSGGADIPFGDFNYSGIFVEQKLLSTIDNNSLLPLLFLPKRAPFLELKGTLLLHIKRYGN